MPEPRTIAIVAIGLMGLAYEAWNQGWLSGWSFPWLGGEASEQDDSDDGIELAIEAARYLAVQLHKRGLSSEANEVGSIVAKLVKESMTVESSPPLDMGVQIVP